MTHKREKVPKSCKKYLITSDGFYTDSANTFREKLQKQFEIHMPQFALYRDKDNKNYAGLALEFISGCKQLSSVQSFLHQHVELALKLQATGVHLASTQLDEIENAMSLGLEGINSTHTHEDVLKAKTLGADYVDYSPIFTSPNIGGPKGVEDLKALLQKCEIKVFALGGIVESRHVEMVEEAGAYGFASIRYFYS